MALLDLDGRVVRVNRAFCRVLQYHETQFVRERLHGTNLFHSSNDSSEIQKLISGANTQLVREHEYMDRPGHSIQIRVSIVLCRDERQVPSCLIAQIQDVSELKKSEEQKQDRVEEHKERVKELTALHHAARLLQSDERPSDVLLRELASLLPSAWERADIAGARVSFDGAVYDSPGFSPCGMTQRASFATAGGKKGSVEIAYREAPTDPGRRSFLPEESELLDSVTEMLKLHLDRTESRRRLDEITKQLLERNRELWSLQQEMGRVEQLAALGWMTGAIAHELGTPLNSVLGYTQLLSREALPKKARRHVETIASQVQRMTGIVQYYLDRTRGSTSKRSRINMNELIRETVALLESVFAEKNVRVVTSLAEPLPAVDAHAGSLQRVLINVLNNAVASIRDQGEITITTRTSPAAVGRRRGCSIEVKDTGAGIPADLLPRVFDVFMTSRPEGSGTGLGLAVSQEIVKEHGGKITISSEIDCGTTVTVFLPAAQRLPED